MANRQEYAVFTSPGIIAANSSANLSAPTFAPAYNPLKKCAGIPHVRPSSSSHPSNAQQKTKSTCCNLSADAVSSEHQRRLPGSLKTTQVNAPYTRGATTIIVGGPGKFPQFRNRNVL